MTRALLEISGCYRTFQAGEQQLTVLKDVHLSIERSEMVAIVGASGSGKSTLMNILGCLDKPSKGAYFIDGQDTSKMDVDELAQLRREHFGFIFQRYHYQGDKLAQQFSAAAAVEAIYESQYRNGAIGIQNWIDAQENRRSAEAALLENRYNQLTAQATLYQALGGSDIAPPLAKE